MHLISTHYSHTHFDRSHPPAHRVAPPSTLAFDTLDACSNQVRSTADLAAYRAQPRPLGNPITGPVYIHGALPGQTLVIDILRIDLGPTGFQAIGPQRGIIRTEFPSWEICPLRHEAGQILFPNGLRLPADPVVGTLGCAPAGDPTNLANPLGGNLDAPVIRTGARVYLPIEVEGALFSLGDLHARQGDGEVVGAPEFPGRVTVRLDLTDAIKPRWPLVEDASHWHTITCAPTEAEALRLGTLEAAHLLTIRHPLSLRDALFLLTMTTQLHCARTGQWAGQEPVVCVSVPKQLLSDAVAAAQKPESSA